MSELKPLSNTPRSTTTRVAERVLYEREELYAVLDAGFVGHMGIVMAGSVHVLPTSYGRLDDTLYIHGSVGAQSVRNIKEGVPICFTVTHLDGIVYGRSSFNHAVNYRSAVIHGNARFVEDPEEKLLGLEVLTEHMAPGSWTDSRTPTKKENAATAMIALPLEEASVKARFGPPGNQAQDLEENRYWAGVLPIVTNFGTPEPCPVLPEDMPIPSRVSERVFPPVPKPSRPPLPTVMPDGSIQFQFGPAAD